LNIYSKDQNGLIHKLMVTADKRHHNARERLCVVAVRFNNIRGSIHNSFDLHLGEFRATDAQAAATQSKHRVFFLHLLNIMDKRFIITKLLGKLLANIGDFWQELVQGRIKETNGNWFTVHDLQYLYKVRTLEHS
jgi:hypothetical protein